MAVLTPDQELLQAPEGNNIPPDPNAIAPIDPAVIQAQQDQAAADNEELEKLLHDLVVTYAEKEDIDLRYTLNNVWRRNTLYFNNIQNIFLDPVARDYRTLAAVFDELAKSGANLDIKTINVYRAFAESIIAALSVEVPAVEFAPDDSENPDDIETADAYTKISIIVGKHNHAALMLIKALTILYNQGTIFAHNCYEHDPAYGMIRKPKDTQQREIPVFDAYCPNCGEKLQVGLDQSTIQGLGQLSCSYCGISGPPDLIARKTFVDEVISYENTPKGRAKFDVYGPTYVKVSLYARSQSALGYLILREENHIAKYKTEYENDDLTDKSDTESYERFARLPIEYFGGMPKDMATKREAWFRPWYYSVLSEENRALLLAKYPSGCKVTIIGDTVVEHKSANLDKEWTITFDPRADYIHAEAPGNASIPLQDAENDIFNLGLQCVEYGIPETFAHPRTLNLQKYGESVSTPGMISPAMPYASDKNLSDGFHTIKPATLSNEYTSFTKELDAKGQFVTGAFPSIYGGQSGVGSKTADEYRQSRSQALQRLQITWRMVKVFWADLIYKCVVDFADNLQEDEKYPEKKNGTYVNVWISKSSLSGKVGQVEPDMNEQLPQSWAQKRDFISMIIEKAPEMAGTILMHPNNSELMKQYAAIPDLYVPGENDRLKQYSEFYQLSQAAAISPTEPSVPIDIDVDDHMVHMQVLKNILVSPVGLSLNPEAYNNCILHYRMHQQAQQAHTIAPSGNAPAGQPPQSATDSSQG